MGAFLTGLHAEVSDEIAGGQGLSVDVDLRWTSGGEDQALTAGLTGATDSARLGACVAIAVPVLVDGAGQADITDDTLSCYLESSSQGRSGPLQVADVRGVLEQARSGSWARRIIFRGDVGTDDPGAAFDCDDGALSVPDPMPTIDGMPLSAELSEGLLRDLG